MKRRASLTFVAAASLLLAACGSRTEDRAISGAGVGAAAGAVVGAVTGLSIVQGVVLGAAAGGLTGAVTSEKDVNLGTPAWRDKNRSTAASGGVPPSQQPPRGAASATASTDNLVARTQSALSARGYDAGPADGVFGVKTRDAIERYQSQNGLTVDGRPSESLVRHIEGRNS